MREYALFIRALDRVPAPEGAASYGLAPDGAGLVALSEMPRHLQWAKVAEEVREAHDAYLAWEASRTDEDFEAMGSEVADAIMAMADFAALTGVDLQGQMAKCILRQGERGRYADSPD